MRRFGLLLLLALLPAGPGLAQAGTSDESVTMSLDQIDLADVLKTFALEYRLNIVAGADVQGKVTMNLFDVPVEEALQAVLGVNGYAFRKSGDFYLVERLEVKKAGGTVEPLETQVVWLNYLSAEEAVKLVAPLKSSDGSFTAGTASDVGIPSNGTEAGGNTPANGEVVILRDRASVLREVIAVLKELDRRPRQVLVEATMLEVKLMDETKLGIDFNTLSGIKFTDLSTVTSNLNSLALGLADKPQITNGFQSAGTFGFASDGNTDGLHVGIVTDDVALFIEALETVTDITVLANPRVLAVNRQPAEILIGAKLGYKTATTTETATVEEVQFLDIGTQLRFRPFISDDGYIRLEIHPENSTGAVDPASGLPSETTTEVTTNILVKDGNTIAIGGLISEQVETNVKQVPFLGSIPYIGVLFRQTVDKISRREVIVLLTTHIVDGGARDTDALVLADSMANNRDLLCWRQLPISRSRLGAPFLERGEIALREGRAKEAVRMAEYALDFMPADVRAAKLRFRALAVLGVPDEEVRALEALEGLK
ncbi:MAG: hypothetical protein V2A76_11545 [Planctomycetota bacterium]